MSSTAKAENAGAHRAWDYETEFWGTCQSTLHEEQKQLVYASRMGLLASWHHAHPPVFSLGGRSVLDIGGGPVSLLLKCKDFSWATVVDPGRWPEWVHSRYATAGIGYRQQEGETLACAHADEAWSYNVLQHVRDPALVIEKMREHARTIRLFEWIDLPAYDGHPHTLSKDALEEWLGQTGFVSEVNEAGAIGRAFYGVFATTT